MFECRNVQFRYRQKQLFQDLSLEIPTGKVTAILGANGSGKSSLLKLLANQQKPQKGQILLKNKALSQWKSRPFAQTVTLVAQEHGAIAPIRVREFLLFGRLPYRGWGLQFTQEDQERVTEILNQTGLNELADSYLDELSGGQRQRVYVAQAFVQETEVLLLDEPTTFLDMHAQIAFFEMIQNYQRRFDVTVVMVLHDVNQALHYSQEVILMEEGQVVAQGPTSGVLTNERIEAVLGIRGQMMQQAEQLPAYYRIAGTVGKGENSK